MTKRVEGQEISDSDIITTTFEVERGKWRAFEGFALSKHRSRAAQIREFIDRALDDHEKNAA